jgi:hypothetical protein
MAEMLSAPRNEFPEFPAALSFLPLLTPETTRDLLSRRRELLARQVSELEAALAAQPDGPPIPRVTMLETEYLLAAAQAELSWVDGILAELAEGSLTWSREELRAIAEQWRP